MSEDLLSYAARVQLAEREAMIAELRAEIAKVEAALEQTWRDHAAEILEREGWQATAVQDREDWKAQSGRFYVRAEKAKATLTEARRRYAVLHRYLYALPFHVLPSKRRVEPEWLNLTTAMGSLGQALEEEHDGNDP